MKKEYKQSNKSAKVQKSVLSTNNIYLIFVSYKISLKSANNLANRARLTSSRLLGVSARSLIGDVRLATHKHAE